MVITIHQDLSFVDTFFNNVKLSFKTGFRVCKMLLNDVQYC